MRPGPSLTAVLAGVVLAATLAAAAAADRGAFTIDSFDVELVVRDNADLVVTERIVVDFLEPRHGIYRTIPVRYTDPKGFMYSLRLSSPAVTDGAGVPIPVRISDEGRYRELRIGDPDRTVRGRATYEISYRVRDALLRFPEHDEVYWNATGNEWNTTIRESSATVRLPWALSRVELEVAGYTGAFGSRERVTRISYPEPGVVRLESRELEPLEGLTVAVAWPPGHVRFPGRGVRAARFVADNWILLAPLLWLGVLWRRYRLGGRDPESAGPVTVQYEPPAGLTPGEIGALIDERVDLRDITASIVDLAVRRHLTIRIEPREALFGLVRKETTVFSRNADAPRERLADHEARILDALFASGDVVDTSDLENRFYQSIPGIQRAIFERLVNGGYFAASPMSVRSRYVGYGVAAALLTVGLGAAWHWIRGGVFPAAWLFPVVAGVATLVLFRLFSHAMPQRTAEGVRARRWALGFQEFAHRVEGDRLQGRDPRQLFESLLPYAMALDVASRWARGFEGIYQAQPPTWCAGGEGSGPEFSTRSLARSVSSAMSRAGAGMTAAPRSSGAGGGGSSGGGGGGGGGGSW